MRAAPLFELRITHPFYADLRCGDLAIVPKVATEALMRRLHLTLKTYRDHLSVYAGLASDGTAEAAAAAPVALDFVLSANRGDFALITDLTAMARQLAPVFTNEGVAAADPMTLRLTTRTARASETLTSVAPSAAERFTLAGTPLAGSAAADFAVSGAGAVMIASPDLRRVTVNTSALSAGAQFQLTYPGRPPRLPGALAEVALTLDAGLLTPGTGPRSFVVPFAAAAPYWAFYVLTDFAGDIATLRIIDATPGVGPRAVTFADSRRVELSLAPDAADAIGLDLVRSNPGRRVIRFLSDAPVPLREAPLRYLELHLADTRLVAGLPNPRPDRVVSLRVVPAPAPAAVALYHVLALPSS